MTCMAFLGLLVVFTIFVLVAQRVVLRLWRRVREQGAGALVIRLHRPRDVGWGAALLPVTIGFLVLAGACVTGGCVLARRTIVADVRARRSGLTARVERLSRTRADAVDSAAAELRRLERDLHDGAQARLVALGINLRTAEKLIEASP